MDNTEIKSDKVLKRVLAIVVSVIILAIAFFGGYYTYYLTMDDDVKTFKWVMDSIKK